ncbi:hypothetical protein ACGFX4_38650 [Kitasatospora sp. NPDC048365]|uniref:hypothetical protein n=1 Tax=Kitasatospora sp. NPDC048365 TaxID=3364050 RepID=UPI003718DC22
MTDDRKQPSSPPDTTALLRGAAEAHRPDRARILARVERGVQRPDAEPGRRRAASLPWWPKAAMAAAATIGVTVAGGFAVAAIGQSPAPQPVRTALAPGTPSPAPDTSTASAPASPSEPAGPQSSPSPQTTGSAAATAGATGSPAPPPSASSTQQRSRTTSPSSPRVGGGIGGGGGTHDGPLWSDGVVDPTSNDYWAQNNVTVRTDEPLTVLGVDLRIALTPGVAEAGHWQSRSGGDFVFTAREEGGYLVYRWALRSGVTLPPGSYVFAGQYTHAADRQYSGDGYHVQAAVGLGPAPAWEGFSTAP